MTTPAFLDSQNRLHRESVNGECPHCGNVVHFSLMACPGFARLQAERPARIGIVLQCDGCHTPVFLRYRVRAWHPDRVEFHPQPEHLERPPEHFSYACLPAAVATVFREALACHSAGLYRAFALLARATLQAMLEDLGERSRLRLFYQVAEGHLNIQGDDVGLEGDDLVASDIGIGGCADNLDVLAIGQSIAEAFYFFFRFFAIREGKSDQEGQEAEKSIFHVCKYLKFSLLIFEPDISNWAQPHSGKPVPQAWQPFFRRRKPR